jgi:hypothetical protein
MSAQPKRRATRRKIVFVRTEFPGQDQSIALAPPVIDAGGDCEFTCAHCGTVLLVGVTSQLDNVVFYCQACEGFNALAPHA